MMIRRDKHGQKNTVREAWIWTDTSVANHRRVSAKTAILGFSETKFSECTFRVNSNDESTCSIADDD